MKYVSNKVGCYFSTMLFFNLLHILKIFNDKNIEPDKWNFPTLKNIIKFDWVMPSWNNIEIFIITFEIIIGIIFLVKIFIYNDDKISQNTKGKTYTINEITDQTQCEYFGKYSLLILTSISLPTNNNIFSFVIFFFVQITIGIVYVYNNLIYINPILTLTKYRIYSCNCDGEDTKDRKLVVITKKELEQTDKIIIRNTNNTVIKLGGNNET